MLKGLLNFEASVFDILYKKYPNMNGPELLDKIRHIYYNDLSEKDRERYEKESIPNNMISLSEVPSFLKQSSLYREMLEDHEKNQEERNIPISPEVFTVENESFNIRNFVRLINICDYWIVDDVPEFLLNIFFDSEKSQYLCLDTILDNHLYLKGFTRKFLDEIISKKEFNNRCLFLFYKICYNFVDRYTIIRKNSRLLLKYIFSNRSDVPTFLFIDDLIFNESKEGIKHQIIIFDWLRDLMNKKKCNNFPIEYNDVTFNKIVGPSIKYIGLSYNTLFEEDVDVPFNISDTFSLNKFQSLLKIIFDTIFNLLINNIKSVNYLLDMEINMKDYINFKTYREYFFDKIIEFNKLITSWRDIEEEKWNNFSYFFFLHIFYHSFYKDFIDYLRKKNITINFEIEENFLIQEILYRSEEWELQNV